MSEREIYSYIENTDCLDGMKNIPSERIDCVITDCPYTISGGGCTKEEKDNFRECKGVLAKRSKHIYLGGMLDDNSKDVRSGKMFQHNDIKFSEWLPEVYRVLKQGTHCYIMVNSRNLKDLWIEAEKVGFKFQNLLVWKKNNATPNKYYMQQLEFILMLRKGAAKNINDMGTTNCLSVPNIMGGKLHPTEKPVALMEVLIRNSTNVYDVVLDPFAGSGSTLIAAKNLSRSYIGFEIDYEYYKIAAQRLINSVPDNTLFI